MIDGIAEQVDEGFTQFVDQGAIELRLLTGNPELHLFAPGLGQVSDHAGKAVKHLPDGHHPEAHGRVLQFGGHPVELNDGAAGRIVI